ncbi:hypothetical protein TNCV_736451 [Trichonephila clavipes]|nr:hypothetical protein TNCV_736451 [Trichonephila clavipes]
MFTKHKNRALFSSQATEGSLEKESCPHSHKSNHTFNCASTVCRTAVCRIVDLEQEQTSQIRKGAQGLDSR